MPAHAQTCPPNIGFENGNFDGWTCYAGVTDAVGTENVITLSAAYGPVYNSHTLFPPNSTELDFYGHFPVHCPNGSGYSVKLGNTSGGGQAEGLSYEFTIPADQNSYTLTYWYAVVFQAPNHEVNEQPRMEIEITNVSDNSVISCASFTYIAVGTSMPGFEVSNSLDSVEVLYKDWSAVSIDLSGNAGKRIKLFFKTADCTFRRHFGYAYIDVNTECNGNLVGAAYCPDDTAVNIVAPYGYQSYSWYDSSMTHSMGTQQILRLSPPPSPGTTFAVRLEPFTGFGCPATMFTKMIDSLTVTADAGRDGLSCNGDTLQLGNTPREGLVYQWSPAEGLTNAAIANPFFVAGISTEYVLTVSNSGGGCRSTDTVKILASVIDNSIQLTGKDAYCLGHGDSAVLQVRPTHKIEWFKDDIPLNGTANKTSYKVNLAGSYTAVLTDALGCSIATEKKTIVIDQDRTGVNYPVKYAIINFPLQLEAREIGHSALWEPSVNLNDPQGFDPTFTGSLEQLYNIVIKSRGGCVTIDTQLVKIVKQVEIYVPAAFTPNNDGRNDYLRPILRGISELRSFRIFNRWGQLLFDGRTELPGWDGRYKGAAQSSQAIVWSLECVGGDGVVYLKKGTAVLVR